MLASFVNEIILFLCNNLLFTIISTGCQEKAQIIGKSTCEKQPLDKFDLSRPPCLETLKISVPTIVNCQCQLKIIQIQRRCCTSQPKVKQICDPFKGRWMKAVENYVLASGSVS